LAHIVGAETMNAGNTIEILVRQKCITTALDTKEYHVLLLFSDLVQYTSSVLVH